MEEKKSVAAKIGGFFKWIGTDLKEIGRTFVKGDVLTKISFIIMGFGQIVRNDHVIARLEQLHAGMASDVLSSASAQIT